MRHPTLLAALAVAVVLVAAISNGHAQKVSSPSKALMKARSTQTTPYTTR